MLWKVLDEGCEVLVDRLDVGVTSVMSQVILDCVKQFGHKWGVIAQRLPGRTEHAIRNRHQRLITISVAAKTQ